MTEGAGSTINPAGQRTEGAIPERREYIAHASDTPPLTGGSKENKHISRDEARGLAWLTWRSNGCEHGLKQHKIAKNGYVYETGDRPIEPRRKSKGVSSRQWGRC